MSLNLIAGYQKITCDHTLPRCILIAVFFHITHDKLRERGNTSSLGRSGILHFSLDLRDHKILFEQYVSMILPYLQRKLSKCVPRFDWLNMRYFSIPCCCWIDINQDHEDSQGFAVIRTKKLHKQIIAQFQNIKKHDQRFTRLGAGSDFWLSPWCSENLYSYTCVQKMVWHYS